MPFAGNFAAHDGSLHSTLMHSWATAMLQFWPHNAAFNSRLFATVRALETQRRLLYGARHTEYSERTRSFSGMPLVFGVSMSQCPCASINRRPAAYAISPGSVFCTCYRTTSPSHSNWDNSTLTNWLSVISGTATVSVEADEECEMYDGGPDGRWDAEERHRGTCRALRMSPRRRRHTRRKLSVWVGRRIILRVIRMSFWLACQRADVRCHVVVGQIWKVEIYSGSPKGVWIRCLWCRSQMLSGSWGINQSINQSTFIDIKTVHS